MSDETETRTEVVQDPTALSRLVNKLSTKASDGGKTKGIRRRTAEVTIQPSICEPDTFEEPFVLGLEGISSQQELEALKNASDGATAGFAMTKKSIRTLNGVKMKNHEVDLVWECLGFAGRTLVMNTYLTQCTGAAEADLGKSLEVEVG